MTIQYNTIAEIQLLPETSLPFQLTPTTVSTNPDLENELPTTNREVTLKEDGKLLFSYGLQNRFIVAVFKNWYSNIYTLNNSNIYTLNNSNIYTLSGALGVSRLRLPAEKKCEV